MRLATKFTMGILLAIVVPVAALCGVGILLMRQTADRAMAKTSEALLEAEHVRLCQAASQRALLVDRLLKDYRANVEGLRTQAELHLDQYPRLNMPYLQDLYASPADTAGLPGYGYVHPRYGAYANWDRRGYAGSIWIRHGIVTRLRGDEALRNQVSRLLQQLMPLTPAMISLHESHADTCDLVWITTPLGISCTYPNDYGMRVRNNPAINEIDESQESYIRDFAPDRNPSGLGRWLNSYLDPFKRIWMVSYVVPLYEHRQFVGTMGIDLRLARLTDVLQRLSPGGRGYLFMLSKEGQPLSLPPIGIADLCADPERRRLLYDMLGDGNGGQWSTQTLEMAHAGLAGESQAATRQMLNAMGRDSRGVLQLTLSGEPKLVAWAPVDETGWRVGIVQPLHEVEGVAVDARDALHEGYKQGLWGFLLAVAAIAGCAVGMGALLGLRTARPLNALTAATERVGRGGEWHEIASDRHDELGDLARSVNRMVRAIGEEQSRFRSIFDGVNDAIFVHDPETGAILEVNRRFEELFGYRAEEARSMQVAELSAGRRPDVQLAAQDWIRRAAAGENPVFIWEGCRRDGQCFWVEVNMRRAVFGDQPRVIAAVRDISERVRAEADLHRLASAVEQAAEVIMITDRAGLIEYVNPAFEQVTGYAREEILGQRPNALKSGEHGPEFYGEMWASLLAGNVWTGRIINRRRDGALIHQEVTISPIRAPHGEIVNFIAVQKDITREVQLERQLHQVQKMEAVGLLAGGVAHDLNNLLTPILGYAELMQRASGLPDRQRQQAKHIHQAGMRARELVRQLMAFGRRQTLEERPHELNEIISTFLPLMRRTLREDIRIRLHLSANPGLVRVDRVQVEQVLMNLAINAQDAMPQGGALMIETDGVRLDARTVEGMPGLQPGAYIRLNVSDTGHGMDSGTRERIFEPFFTTKERGQGTGLGLATVYGIIRQHKGHISVYSEVDRGTTFKIYLPALAGEDPIPVSEGMPEVERGSETILVVEDNEPVRVLTCAMLEEMGYHVVSEPTPAACLERAAELGQGLDLILTDVVMPEVSGLEVYERIRALHPEVRVLFMSGYPAQVIAKQGVLEEGLHFIQKPFGQDALARKLREVVSEQVPQGWSTES